MGAPLCSGLLLLMAVSFSGVVCQPQQPPVSTANGVSSVSLYLPSVTYDVNHTPPTSELHILLKEMFIGRLINATRGSFESLTISDGNGCPRLFLEWRGGNLDLQTRILNDWVRTGISFGDLKISIELSFTGCRVSVRQCPVVKPGTFGSCIDACDDSDPARKCQVGAKCCSNGCGRTCVQVSVRQCPVVKPGTFGSCIDACDDSDPARKCPVGAKCCSNGCGRTCVQVSVRQCPVVKPGTFGSCNEACDDSDPVRKCPVGAKCCSNGCGHTCVQVEGQVDNSNHVEFNLIVVGLPWTEEYKNQSSAYYSMIRTAISSEFASLGGELVNVELRRNYNCVEIFVQWMPEYKENLLNLIESVSKNGMRIKDTMYKISNKRCQMPEVSRPDHFMELTVFVVGLPWSDAFEDKASFDYSIVKSVILMAFKNISGELQGFELKSNYDCLEIFIQMMYTNKTSVLDLLANLTRDGVMVGDVIYEISTEPCDYEEVSICNMTTNACGENGECTGNYEENEICSCKPGYSDLFCELDKPENLTECQRMRRLMLFVHNQVTGAQPQLATMNVPMRDMLIRLHVRIYSVPYCLPHSDVTNGEFYSMCDYAAATGQKIKCYCTDRWSNPNFWHYVDQDDCRVYNQKLEHMMADMFIHNFSWTEDLMMENSLLYLSIKSQIQSHMSPAGGYLSILKFYRKERCVLMSIAYMAEKEIEGRALLNSLPGTKLMVHAEEKMISYYPCKEEIDVSACPKPRPDFSGICLFECDDDRNMTCAEGRTCCINECGGGICLELGFLQKMNVNITMQWEFQPEYEDPKSQEYLDFKENIVTVIHSLMVSRDIRGYSSVKLVGFKRASSKLHQIGTTATRERRQTLQTHTIVLLQFRFTEEVPVDELMGVKRGLMQNGIDFNSTTFNILNVDLGIHTLCGDVYCHYNSICVERIGGGHQCACSSGYTGSQCQRKTCHHADGTSMCQNKGSCDYNPYSDKFMCHCPPRFHGDYCETNMCEFFVSDACNGGTCVASMADMRICKCPPNKGGLFCQDNIQREYNQSLCERHHEMANYVVSILNGSTPRDMLKIDVSQLLALFNATAGTLMVPSCRYDIPDHYGAYHYYCGYDTRTGAKSTFQDCLCTSINGTPNYYSYQDGMCVVYVDNKNPCDRNPCINRGVCQHLPNNDYSCKCHPEYEGKSCEKSIMGRCPNGEAGLMKSFGLWTCGTNRPCPVGFQCHGDTFNGTCCFKEDFLCDLNMCQNGGKCVNDLQTGQICECGDGKGGLFCDINDDDNVQLTSCETLQRFTSWLVRMLKTGATPQGMNLDNLRTILAHIHMDYIPTDMCDEQGRYKTKVTAASIFNVRDEKEICLDENGIMDPMCKDEICNVTKGAGLTICLNGGRCVGDFQHGFCDCSGTGHHGVRCDMPGERANVTDCMRAKDLVRFLIGLVNGSIQLNPNVDRSESIREMFEVTEIPSIFEPDCDARGKFAYKGCAHSWPKFEEKVCFCATADGQQVGDEQSIVEPPQRCPMGPEEKDCPPEWGADCKKPNWWCTHEVQCKPGEEKCYFAVDCNDKECSNTPEIHCVPEELKLPCEPVPCEHNKYKLCPPCGEEASCFHVAKHAGGNMDNKNDDNDSDDKEYGDDKEDDNDSAEKRMSWMKPKGRNYICECPIGRMGPNCEVYNEVCRTIDPSLCPHGCIGDLKNGKLCRCPAGFGGLQCNKVVRTPCQTRKAFFDDSLDILRGRLTIRGFDSNELKRLVKVLVRLTGGDSIPEVNCTENGFFDKVQCVVNVYDFSKKDCFCVNHTGDYLWSNIMPHIGYDVCTGPFDFREFLGTCFIQGVTICQNGGSCIFDLYKGKICSCRPRFHGQLCEKTGEPEDKPESLCDFMRDAYYYAQDMLKRKMQGSGNDKTTMLLYKIMTGFININSSRTNKGYPPAQVALKVECTDDGEFKNYVCDHDLVSDQRIACYCMGQDGPLIGTEAPNPESLNCSNLGDMGCHELDECPELDCEHGNRHNLAYCPICECRHPCEGHKCDNGERCVVRLHDCDKNDGEKKCSFPVCVQKHKPGVCPGQRLENLNTLIGGLRSQDEDDANSDYNDDQCQVKCHDDADCEGSKKCCGLCGNMCVEPKGSEDCLDQLVNMMEHLEFIKESANLTLHSNTPLSLLRAVTHTEGIKHIWVPECMDSNYAPVQCMYNISSLIMGHRVPTECFCVDRMGHRIKESVGVPGDNSSCDVKPFLCPVLHPSTDDDASDECSEDMDCAKSNKCCFDGFHHVCAQPTIEPEDKNIVDMIMDDMCLECTSGSCSSKWDSDGIVCECDSYQKEPFCGMRLLDGVEMPRTACERKRLMTSLFLRTFQMYKSGHSYPQNYTIVRGIFESAEKLMKGLSNEMLQKVTTKLYECDDLGNYEPMLCEVSIYHGKRTNCFCVDEQGKELPGTRKPYGQMPSFCKKDQTCLMGHALHGEDGNFVTCSKSNMCPYGYSCTRGMYGNLHCCPNKEEMKDICRHPVDIGHECRDPTSRYFYNAESETCESFVFKGCGGNRNSFETMEDCMKRCKDMMHFGTCPTQPFEVSKTKNCGQNKCESDTDCPSDKLKCCQSTCGKRCIPAIDDSPADGQCPVGPRKPQPEVCSYSGQCSDSFYCYKKSYNLIDKTGYCCFDARFDINYCRMKPFMLSKELDDDSDKDDDDNDNWEETPGNPNGNIENPLGNIENPLGNVGNPPQTNQPNKDDDDDDDDDDKPKDDDGDKGRPMTEGSQPEWAHRCEEPMPRYYYNHEQKQCEMYYGCDIDFNTFETREDCCETCSTETRCKAGKCPQLSRDIIVSCQDECLNDYECAGNKICCSTGCSLTCVDPYDENNSTCWAQLREAQKVVGTTRQEDCNNIAMPRCEDNGDFSRQQCLPSFSICWCVTSRGNYLTSSLTRGVAPCDLYSDVDMNMADKEPQDVKEANFSVCSEGQKVHCCSENLCKKRCHAHPEAMCRINPCDGCSAEFYDADNNLVGCDEGLTACQLELKDVIKIVSARAITAEMEEEDEEAKEQEERRNEMSENRGDWGSVIYEDIPLKCQKMPETGNCKRLLPRWYFNPKTRKCDMFIWSMCGGNENRFRTPKECYDQCDSSSNPCAAVRCGTPKPVCTLTYDQDCYMKEGGCTFSGTCTAEGEDAHLVSGIFVPRCLASGAYNNKQCHGHFCWCIDDDGEYAGGLSANIVYNDLQCTHNGPTVNSVIVVPDCPAGSYSQKPRPDCMKACNDQVCPGHPKAKCVVDLCSDICQTSFKDEYGFTVDCQGNKCDTFSFDNDDKEDCEENLFCDGESNNLCSTNICENANAELCPKNPCAICMVDSCTCQPYFVDAITSEHVDSDSRECKYLVKGACTLQTCKLKLDNVADNQLPQCSGTGSFSAKQCHGSACYCVKADGNFVKNISASGNCDEIDEIKKLELSLSFNGNFQRLKSEGKLGEIKRAVKQKFIIDFGIPEGNIKYISEPYEGSVKVDVVIAEDENNAANDVNIGVIANSITQRIQNDDFNIEVGGENLAVQKDKSVIVLVPKSIVDSNDDDDDGLSEKEIIIIAASCGGVAFLVLIAVLCCCCCKEKKKPEVVDDIYDHIREPKADDKNIYDNPSTLYNNKDYEVDGHYMEVQEDERYMKVRL